MGLVGFLIAPITLCICSGLDILHAGSTEQPILSDDTDPSLVAPADIEAPHDQTSPDRQPLVLGDGLAERREHGPGVVLQIIP